MTTINRDSYKAKAAQAEVKALIRFYERRGWCWLSAVAFLAGDRCLATGVE